MAPGNLHDLEKEVQRLRDWRHDVVNDLQVLTFFVDRVKRMEEMMISHESSISEIKAYGRSDSKALDDLKVDLLARLAQQESRTRWFLGLVVPVVTAVAVMVGSAFLGKI